MAECSQVTHAEPEPQRRARPRFLEGAKIRRSGSQAESPPVLWHFPISHFNQKVRWALDFKRIPHVRRALGPSYLFKAWWATGHAKLPILFLQGKAIGDSTRIIEALERCVASQVGLLNHEPQLRGRVARGPLIGSALGGSWYR